MLVTVTFKRLLADAHGYALARYEVVVDGVKVGRVQVGFEGFPRRKVWRWLRYVDGCRGMVLADPSTRRQAASEMLGYLEVELVIPDDS